MRHWCSAVAPEQSLRDSLDAVGLEALPIENAADHCGNDILLIYSSPDQLLQQWRDNQDTPPSKETIQQIFQTLSQLSVTIETCAASWRLNQLDRTSLLRLIRKEQPFLDQSTLFPEANPLASLITLNLLQEIPEIFEHYLNLELRSKLFGLEADVDYLNRLRSRSIAELTLTDWWQVNPERECSQEQATANLLRMQQLQKDYEQILLDQDDARKLLKDQNKLSRKLLIKYAKRQLEP